MAKKSPFQKGRNAQPKSSAGAGLFVKTIKPDTAITIAPLQTLSEMISLDVHELWDVSNPAVFHPCLEDFGGECPGCLLGDTPTWKSYLLVKVKGEEGAKVFPFKTSIRQQLEAIEDDYIEDGDTIVGKAIKISRTGSGRNDTKYMARSIGKEIDVSDVEIIDFIPLLGSEDPMEIWAQLEERTEGGVVRSDYVKEGPIKKGRSPKKEKVVEAEDDESAPAATDEDDDDLW